MVFQNGQDVRGSTQQQVCIANLQPKNVQDVHSWARTAVVLISSDVFAAQKLASGSVHGCTLPDRMSVVISSRSFCSIRPPSVTDMKKRPDVVAQLQ